MCTVSIGLHCLPFISLKSQRKVMFCQGWLCFVCTVRCVKVRFVFVWLKPTVKTCCDGVCLFGLTALSDNMPHTCTLYMWMSLKEIDRCQSNWWNVLKQKLCWEKMLNCLETVARIDLCLGLASPGFVDVGSRDLWMLNQ